VALTGRSAGRDQQVEVAVDWLRCDGNGLCADLLPELVRRDDWGYPMVAPGPVPAELRRLAVRARAACPAMAFRLRPVDGVSSR
jgi:ferredoxin